MPTTDTPTHAERVAIAARAKVSPRTVDRYYSGLTWTTRANADAIERAAAVILRKRATAK